ncbi:MAG: SGNH/GDSL hydrolase family protein [Vicinamibacterales bacterium]
MRGMVKEWLLRAGLMAASLLVALALAEVTVRTFYPVLDGRGNVTLDGRPIKEWFAPGSVYRQVSNEYDAVTTITGKGHRVPGSDGSPEVVFVGDSFTYGYGLKDDETFASIYCAGRRVACANLGLPGSGTARQVARLDEFLRDWQWTPKEVKLFFFGMSGSLSAGNDFVDNYNYGRWLKAQSSGAVAPPGGVPRRTSPSTLTGRLIGWQSSLLEHSHMMRRAKFHWGPLLKSLVVNDPGEERMAEALAHTGRGLTELDSLSRRAGFDYSIYLIVPVQDIIRRTHTHTLAALNRVSPKPAVSTAPLFADAPQDFYYAYDGHLNPRGSRRVAELLLSFENDTSNR